MASNPTAFDTAARSPARVVTSSPPTVWATLEYILRPLASLRLTVILLTLSVALVTLGTLAQWQKDIWVVVDEYFRCWVAWAPFEDCVPPKLWPGRPHLPGGFPFPGGALIGVALLVNLFAAHTVRFKIQAKGSRLIAGVLAILAGIVITYLVIESGSNKSGAESSSVNWAVVWWGIKGTLVVGWIASIYGMMVMPKERQLERWLLISLVVGLGLVAGWLVYAGDSAQLDDSSMRILWQLAKGTLAGAVLYAGCYLLFKQRAGIVVLHAGIGLMMLNEVNVTRTHVESQMMIEEGQTATYTQDIRSVELAIVDKSAPGEDVVTVIPGSRLKASAEQKSTLSDPLLPVNVRVLKYLTNSMIEQVKPSEASENLATAGIGLNWTVTSERSGAGTDAGGKVDLSSAYVQFLNKEGQPLGTHLVSLFEDIMPVLRGPQTIQVGDRTYQAALRFKRIHKPYEVTLIDVKKEDYLGTDTPRNYSSDVRLVDPELSVDRQVHIWMNNPLRFRDETFYQSGYHVDPRSGKESTTLQVVTNNGWMVPYVSCMIVMVGMLAQFGQTLLRFTARRDQEQAVPLPQSKNRPRHKPATTVPEEAVASPSSASNFFSGLLLAGTLLFALQSLVYSARVPVPQENEMNLYAFGQIPVAFEGRIKPFDTLARNALRIIANTETFTDENGKRGQPAIKWLLDVITEREFVKGAGRSLVAAEEHHVFKIDSLDVQGLLGLKPRERFRYGVGEIRPKSEEFNKEVKTVQQKAKKLGDVSLTPAERAIAQLDTRIRRYTLVHSGFRDFGLPRLPTVEDFNADQEKAKQAALGVIQRFQGMREALEAMKPPRALPAITENGKDEWQILSVAEAEADFMRQIPGQSRPLQPAMKNLETIFEAYRQGDAQKFNREVASYQASLADQPPLDYQAYALKFESYFNHFRPFYLCWMLYLLAMVLADLSWLGWSKPFNRAAFWLILFTLAVHTAAIVARIYISGRPPVTNLYTTAIFIGWGCVVLSIVLELIFKLGVGNSVGAAVGVATLEIADRLAADGDTFTVLQAVLDTQFWLSTHVVCINLGYATTILAGAFGAVYILMGVLTPGLTGEMKRALGRMVYGTLCFAIFFSFVGTVLGGLWADDSWGRFWGWDPKENGALMIVLWNAVVLHARWGGIVKERGMANLSLIGNIIVSWSWFGVNELGIGLHAYGSTEGTIRNLYLFGLANLAIVALGCVPYRSWVSNHPRLAKVQ